MTLQVQENRSDHHASPVEIATATGNLTGGEVLLVCEHASNYLPPDVGDLGLGEASREAHIAWDIGALALSRDISSRLDCGLVYANVSRLVVDLNRKEAANDVIPSLSESTHIPGNKDLSPNERTERISTYHTPFHQKLAEVLDDRAARNLTTHLVSIHSFTATYRDVNRPWHAGIIHNDNADFAKEVITGLRENSTSKAASLGLSTIEIGENQPYSPSDGVFHTLDVHGEARNLPTAMVEIRNDLLRQPAQIATWAGLMQQALTSAIAKRQVQHGAG